jgi:hypothetical protein
MRGTAIKVSPRLNHVLHEVIPGCMTQDALHAFIRQDVRAFDPTVVPDKQKFYLFHVEADVRIYELYSYMDSGEDGGNEKSLAFYVEKHKPAGSLTSYLGPWALETMGGAGGQTIAGVASTATHGGGCWVFGYRRRNRGDSPSCTERPGVLDRAQDDPARQAV